MKKNLRLLCLGLAAATFTCSFAQEDKTSLLENTDMALGLKGWAFDGEKLMGKNTKDLTYRPGFYGMNMEVLETWNGSGAGLADGYVMQRVAAKDLPSGTYVFGAYAAASKQGTEWSNRDSINGVWLFANDKQVKVATDNPDRNSEHSWAHSAKFNVAINLSDEVKKDKPYVDFGLRYSGTNANYVVWDNVTLYYFGNMSEAEALDAMAEIDMDSVIAIADTLTTGIVMHRDTLKNLKTAIQTAKDATTTAATLWKNSEDLFWNMGLARKSAADYASLKKSMEHAKNVQAGVWTEHFVVQYGNKLKNAIENAEYYYGNTRADRAKVNEVRAELEQAAGFMRLDSLTIAKTALEKFLADAPFTDAPGQYSTDQENSLIALQGEVNDTINAVTAADAVNPKPQLLYPYIKKIYAAIEEVESNPYDGAWLQTLPQSADAVEGYKPLEGTVFNDSLGYIYESPLIEFGQKTELVRLTVTKVASNQRWFCISGLEFFAENGDTIKLTAADVATNADHNSFGSKDGDGIPALVDGDCMTYFHSDWTGTVTEPHYLEVTLPDGGYDAVSFKIIARNATPNHHKHQFPGEIVLTTPIVKKGLPALEKALADAKALNPYSGSNPGFYAKKFTALADAMAKAEAIIANYTTEADCNETTSTLRAEIEAFKNLTDADLVYNVPVADKKYRIVSGFTGFFEKQSVEKALTVHTDSLKTLWWENACTDSTLQEFYFEPILDEDGYPYVELKTENEKQVPYYCYNLKNVATGLYVDTAFVDNQVRLVETAADTVKIKWLGRGQWNILMKNGTFHCGDHNGGSAGTGTGAYGGVWGVSSSIVSWGGDLDGASAWFIREVQELPLSVLVANGEFKSECIHFDAANTITLVADKNCAFDGLKLYDLYGSAIAIDSTAVVSENIITIHQKENLVACAFGFNNAEGVTSVSFDAGVPMIQNLQKAYDVAVAVNPQEGTGVAQYADLTAYNAAIAKADELLTGGGSDGEMTEAIAALEKAVAELVPNMPDPNKVYAIYNAVDFEKNLGYKMVLAAYNSNNLRWKGTNYLDVNQYWQFESATVEQLKAAGADTTAVGRAFYIKNLGLQKYLSDISNTENVTTGLVDTISAAMPVVITVFGQDTEVALDGLGEGKGKRIHANGHGGGKGTGGNIVYWASGVGTASAWNIVEEEATYTLAQLGSANFDDSVEFVEADETVVKGIFDLFGRRIDTPTEPGIYIIDGKKKLIK